MQVPDNSVNSFSFDCALYTLSNDVYTSFPEINALHAPNPLDDLDVTNKSNPLNLYAEQQKDTNIKLVLHWLEKGPPSPTPYMNTELKKFIKHFGRLENHHGVQYRKFFDDTGRIFIRQYVVPQHLREEILYRIHNSKYASHPGIAKTAERFCKRFYFPGFVEFLAN